MSNSGKQSPLGVNVLSGLLQGKGFYINKTAAGYMGISEDASTYTPGSIVSGTVLRSNPYAIREGYVKYNAGSLSATTYNNLISMGATVPSLGNSPPPTFTWGNLNYTTYTDQSPNWNPYNTSNTANIEVTSWGYGRLFPLQAYNEFNYNNTLKLTQMYSDFLGSWLAASSFIDYTNKGIIVQVKSFDYLDGTYSNMNDLISGDITGISLSTSVFGQDLINTGKAINMERMWTFGLPSNLLETLQKYNAITQSLKIALLASGLSASEIETVSANSGVTTLQQQKLYSAFLVMKGVDLSEILVSLNCNTPGLETVADLLNIKKLFPTSYQTLTVPIYNATKGLPTNSKTYYPIFTTVPEPPAIIATPAIPSGSAGVNPALASPEIAQIIGTIIPPGVPVIEYDRDNGRDSDFGGFSDSDAGFADGTTGDSFGDSSNGGSGGGGDGGVGGGGDGGGDGGSGPQ
jgi:uncharacterized membrane protein YgcG